MNNKPNLLVIHTDQQSTWTLSSYGGKLVDTPNIDYIGKEGVILNNFFTNSARCTPSRACLLTGKYPHSTGVYDNNMVFREDEVTIANVLEQNGYDTGYIGKWHLDGDAIPGWVDPDRSKGFKDNLYMFNRGHWKKVTENEKGKRPVLSKEVGDENTYTTDWLTTKSIEFMNRTREKPFFLMLSIPDPHSPLEVRAPFDTMYNPDDMPVPESFFEENRPSWVEDTPNGTHGLKDCRKKGITAEEIKRRIALYCGDVKCIDYNVGRILKYLDKKGILDDTIIIYTSDHGDYMGEHALTSKNSLYEPAYRVPFLIRWPRKIPKGNVIKNVFSTVDFQSTVLGLMGIETTGREQGRDGSKILQGQNMEWKDESYLYHTSWERAGIFTKDYELALVKEGGHILFDRNNDPQQINNLFGNPDYKDVLKELTEKIIKHNEEFDTPAKKWLKNIRI